MDIMIKAEFGAELPSYQTKDSAGADLRAYLPFAFELHPGMIIPISTGISVAIPKGYEMQIRSRSGWASRGVVVANSPGTIDSDYRGVVKVLLQNNSNESIFIQPNDRIAQAVIAPIIQAEWLVVDELDATERGEGGFGHTGGM